ncbi:MAG: helix-turn-helix transcriptional regulator [Acidimicrobiales bacterium]
MAPLVIQFIEQTFRPESELYFGRNAELSLDTDNGYLHRRAGRFRLIGDIWWLENRGSRLRLKMVSADGSVIDLHAGASSPVLGQSGIVSLVAGPTRYEVGYWIEQEVPDLLSETLRGVPVGADTVTYGTKLTPRELDFVVVLAQGRLTGRGGPLPSHADIAETWGVSKKTVDNTLQRLRSKLRTKDVRFLDSSEMLVEYLVSQGLVTIIDLEWAGLDQPDGPRTAAIKPD